MGPMANDGILINSKTIERGRRCQNCIHFDAGPKARQHYDALRQRDIIAEAKAIVIREGKLPEDVQTAHKQGRLAGPKRIGNDDPGFARLQQNFIMGDSYMQAGAMGICRKGIPTGDFVHAMYLCEHWSARVKPDGADEKGDMTSEEIKDREGME